ncbi:aldehyde dehydrogenase (NADP(+)) [Membranihabitans maritimus]|uniref:aldehyde dehydrogenase (NADP(+)) n=1 Tax=Membranihabitans maritimus TaxID=2904244 RepID=UPI001F217B92|nr:aldehyde dehydrogenase (NADP(+)) [Membranihabitans maritimus]
MSNIITDQRIGYKLSSEGTNSFRSHDPAKNQASGPEFMEATEAEVEKACEIAGRAFLEYRKWSGKSKAAFLDRIADEIEKVKEELVKVADSETALGEGRLNGECGRTTGQLRFFAKILREGSWVNATIDCATTEDQGSQGDIRQIQVPLGPVVVFGASNFPLAFSTAGGDTASALAAGCPVVYKAHPAHPQTSSIVGNAILKAAEKESLPEGVFSIVYGTSHTVGGLLVTNENISAVGFTGSYKGGKALFDLANNRPVPIPVFAEMGSVNPVFLLPGKMENHADELAKGLAGSINLGVGQFCTNPGVFVTFRSETSDRFLGLLKSEIEGAAEGTMLTKGIASAYCSGTKALSSIPGVETIVHSSEENGTIVRPALYKTNLTTIRKRPEILEEVFGPSSLNIVIDESELGDLIELFSGQLTATIHGDDADIEKYSDLAERLAQIAGRVIFNGFPTGVAVNNAMIHGGPFPATTNSSSTSVGGKAIYRFTRGVSYQAYPQELLPEELKYDNPLNIWRLLNGEWTKNQE